jgi:hypothetical protein
MEIPAASKGDIAPDPWSYSPLEQTDRSVRLLRLQPGRTEDLIRCDLQTVSLDDKSRPDYGALSYVWGSIEPGETIMFNGVPGKKISANLAAALRQLRKEDEATLLWVDQLCINQEDLDERGQQVQLMSAIYSGASYTPIWLGEAREDTVAGLQILKLASEQYFQTAWSAVEYDETGTTKAMVGTKGLLVSFDSHRNAQMGFPPRDDVKWEAFLDIITRSWFKRV